MKVEPNAQDLSLLNLCFEGNAIPSGIMDRYMAVRRRMLLMGSAGPLAREAIALVCEARMDGMPFEDDLLDDLEEPANDNVLSLTETQIINNPESVQHRTKVTKNGKPKATEPLNFATTFKSQPGDPWKKVEKDRPLTYISPKDGARYGGRFVKVDANDKARIIIRSNEFKKNFGIPEITAELSDLSPIPLTLTRQI